MFCKAVVPASQHTQLHAQRAQRGGGALVGLLAAQAGGDDELLLRGSPLPRRIPPRPQLRQPVPVLRLLRRLHSAFVGFNSSAALLFL